MSERKDYLLVCGEGSKTSFKTTVAATPMGIKCILARSRKGLNCWAEAYLPAKSESNCWVNIETEEETNLV